MAFTNTNSIVDDDANNMLRGLHRNNADSSHTGDADETVLSSFSLAGGTMTSTGAVHILAGGTTTGTTDTKTVRLDFDLNAVSIATISIASGATTDWFFDAWVFNTATNAQRIIVRGYEGTATLEGIDYLTSSVDTTAGIIIRVTGQLGGTTDTITQTLFNIFVVQVT